MLTSEIKTWEEVFPPEHGIFEAIQDEYHWDLPDWVGISPIELDQMAWGQYGYRKVSLMVQKYYDRYALNYWKRDLARAVWGLYHKKWEKMIALAELEYDPIHNFSDTLHEQIVGTEDETTTDDIDKTGLKVDVRNLTVSRLNIGSSTQNDTGTQNNQRTDNLTETVNRDVTTDYDDHNQNNLYGFNSQDVVGDSTSGEQSKTHMVEKDSARENTGTQVNLRTDNLQKVVSDSQNLTETDGGEVRSNTTDTEDKEEVRDLDTTRVRDMTRTGNIGNLSTQNLIQQEIELWRWKFIQEILDDVKDFGTLPIYV